MENRIKGVADAQITLRVTNYDFDTRSYICDLCGTKYLLDGSGFYYFIGDTEACVCDLCAEKEAPELVSVRREALSAACLAESRLAECIRTEIASVIKEQFKEQIIRVLDRFCVDTDSRFQKSNMG